MCQAADTRRRPDRGRRARTRSARLADPVPRRSRRRRHSGRHQGQLEEVAAVQRQAFDKLRIDDRADHVARHFEQEEDKLFAKLRHAKLDLAGLGEQLAARQLERGTASPDKKVFAEGRRVLG